MFPSFSFWSQDEGLIVFRVPAAPTPKGTQGIHDIYPWVFLAGWGGSLLLWFEKPEGHDLEGRRAKGGPEMA